MLRISKLSDYAIVVMSYLALDASQIASAAIIAKQVHLSTHTVSKILKILSSAQLVVSSRGKVGGYQLARPAHEITVAQLVMAIEGKFAITECCVDSGKCALDSVCSLKDNWQIINRVILTALEGLTIRDMLQSVRHHPLMAQGLTFTTTTTPFEKGGRRA